MGVRPGTVFHRRPLSPLVRMTDCASLPSFASDGIAPQISRQRTVPTCGTPQDFNRRRHDGNTRSARDGTQRNATPDERESHRQNSISCIVLWNIVRGTARLTASSEPTTDSLWDRLSSRLHDRLKTYPTASMRTPSHCSSSTAPNQSLNLHTKA